jgi:hypothetical protein
MAETGSTSRRHASTFVNGSLIACTVPKDARGRNDIRSQLLGLVSAPPEGADPARLAEAEVQEGLPARRCPLIVHLRFSSSDQASAIGRHNHEPRAGLGANGAIALGDALAEIDVCLEADGAAVAASATHAWLDYAALKRNSRIAAATAGAACHGIQCSPPEMTWSREPAIAAWSRAACAGGA